ncbi:MAG TPA: RICIN domain-containing protein [Verrucomicrobiae bacterium]
MKKSSLLSIALLTCLASFSARATDTKTYGACWAWNNNFNDPYGGIHDSFDSGSYPGETIWFDFTSSSLYGYPAICRGWHYGYSATGDTMFPAQVSQLSSIPCQFSYQSGGSGMQGDFAYDTFLRWDNAKSSPQVEVMVWAGHNSFPIGTCTGYNVLYTANTSWDIWEGYNSAAGYYVYTFVPDGTVVWPVNTLPTSGSMNVDLKAFYQWLQNNRSGDGRFNLNMYLDVVECGFEVVEGNGWCYFNGWIDSQQYGSGGVANGTYKLINQNSGLAMDAYNQGTANGTQIQQWTYWGGAGQQWTVTGLGNNLYKIIGVQSGKSIDINAGGTSNGTKVQLWDFWGGSNQQFGFNATGNGYCEIVPQNATGSRLDVNGASTAAGALVQLWQANGGNNQKWSFQAP